LRQHPFAGDADDDVRGRETLVREEAVERGAEDALVATE
jgi:hypothetical protein